MDFGFISAVSEYLRSVHSRLASYGYRFLHGRNVYMTGSGFISMEFDVRVTNEEDIETETIPGGFEAGWLMEGEKLLMGIGTAQPGEGETWHEHEDEFEEIYYVLSGKGRIRWEEDEEIKEVTAEEGDSVLIPTGGFKNEIEAIGDEPWTFVFAATNLPDTDTYRK